MNLIWFEGKKTWQTRKTYLFLLLGLLLTVILFIFNSYQGQKENNAIALLTEDKTEVMGLGSYSDEINQFLKETNQNIAIQEENFRTDADQGKSLIGKLTLPTYPFYRKMLNEELVKRKLPPQSMRYGTRNTIFTAILFSYLASSFGIVWLLFLFGDSLTKEIEEQSMYFYFSQPVKRGRLYFTKYFLVWLQSVLAMGLVLVFGFVVASLFSGASSFDYPVIVFTEKSMTMIPILQYTGQVFLVFMFVLGFCFALHFLVSILLKKTSFSIVITLLILFEGYTLSTLNNDFMRKIAQFNPFVYLNVSRLFVGYDFRPFELFSIENQEYYANWCLPRTLHNAQINSINGLFTLTVGTILLLSLGYFCFKKNVHRWKI
ncbi:ABC transporter permease [Enterococcus crotali]|uniref:ABC transporter permease n=1 Tax=Enterococcus crotali TaxID=1453587 RepID=UPI0004704BBE|nr:ABC transporter permease subunit [Enterococcus crotali]